MTQNLTTFRVSDKQAEKVKIYNVNDDENIATHLDLYRNAKCGEILHGTKFIKGTTYTSNNSFVNTILRAYNEHHNVILRPDDIWTAIITQFSFYVNANAEEFRGQFVNFQGKKELEVKIPGQLRNAPYDLFVTLMSQTIHENLVDGQVKDWILPKFSTTTQNDEVTCGVIFMAAMKKYFDYKCCLMCGIPNISLDGTVEDWKNIKGRISKLRSYKLDKWADILEPVLEQFVQAKSGIVDNEFWQRICSHHGGGSGPRYISGWITAFCYFNGDGEIQGDYEDGKIWPKIDTNDIPSGIVEVDVKIDDNGMAEYKSVMLAGHMAVKVLEDEVTLQPQSGWIIALKKTEEEGDEASQLNY